MARTSRSASSGALPAVYENAVNDMMMRIDNLFAYEKALRMKRAWWPKHMGKKVRIRARLAMTCPDTTAADTLAIHVVARRVKERMESERGESISISDPKLGELIVDDRLRVMTEFTAVNTFFIELPTVPDIQLVSLPVEEGECSCECESMCRDKIEEGGDNNNDDGDDDDDEDLDETNLTQLSEVQRPPSPPPLKVEAGVAPGSDSSDDGDGEFCFFMSCNNTSSSSVGI